ncbi:MAG: phospholipase domain-containing protein [Ilyomonas sp.]
MPYELYADAELSADKKTFNITFTAGKNVFGHQSAGSPFIVYAPGKYGGEICHNRDYAVRAGDKLNDQWITDDFENGLYHLQVYGPNGFFREFSGDKNDPLLSIQLDYERSKTALEKLTGNIVLNIKNLSNDNTFTIDIIDKSYKKGKRTISVNKANPVATVVWDLNSSFRWYDVSVKVQGYDHFEKRYAGRVETGEPGKTDPLMGRMV